MSALLSWIKVRSLFQIQIQSLLQMTKLPVCLIIGLLARTLAVTSKKSESGLVANIRHILSMEV
jgi:hypothetical protein